MTTLGRLVIWEATRALRTAQRLRIRVLERELAQYSTAADRADLTATLDRYPDYQTTEIRTILALQETGNGLLDNANYPGLKPGGRTTRYRHGGHSEGRP